MLIFILILVINVFFLLIIGKYFQVLRSILDVIRKNLSVWISGKLILITTRLFRWTEILRRNLSLRGDENNFNLTPIKNADQSGLYLNLLREKVVDPDTMNVALTGRYGSGKSSLIRTFELQHPEFKFLNISLAAFNIEKPIVPEQVLGEMTGEKILNGNKTKKTKGTKESLQIEAIEYSILQQIFYHVKHQRIPYSRFKRIKNQPFYVLFLRSLLFVLWCGTVTYLILHDNIFAKATDWKPYFTWPVDVIKILPGLYAATGAVYLLYLIFRTYNNSKFHKLNLTSGEVEISPENELSILNRHMDELIYFFEATNFNVVVLEDLDRFNDPEIFTHLRELNVIINNSEQVRRKITFIYALRDDVFKNEKRTKFFDYIIPVIPVVDTTNSAEQIRTRLTNIQLEDNAISEVFITDIAQYVKDMRLIVNTLNEFNLYRIRLQSSKEGNVPLLAMMFFKNMFPKQFAKLQEGKGSAFKLLNSRQDFLNKISAEFAQEAVEITQEIEDLKRVNLNNLKELRSVYIYHIIAKIPAPYGNLKLAGNVTDLKDLNSDDNFELITAETNFKYELPNGTFRLTGFSFADIEKEINYDYPYEKRQKDLQNKYDSGDSKLQRRLLEIRNSIDKIRKLTLQEILEVKSLEVLAPELATNGLLTFLVSSGYITEDYHYYLSYFYPGSLSMTDMEFFFAMKEGRSLNFDHQLEKIETLVNRLVIRDFSSVNIFNNSLLTHLLNTPSREAELTALMLMLANESEKSVSFIAQYLRIGESKANFVKQLGRFWKRLFTWSKTDSQLPPETQLEYLGWILSYCRPEDLPRLNFDESLRSQLNMMPDFVSWIKSLVETDQSYQIISALDLSFERLENLEPGDLIAEYIYMHNHYVLNPNMISLLAAFRRPDVTLNDLQKANLTTLIQLDLEDMLGYIEENMSEYIENVFLVLPENTRENEGAVIYMLEQPAVTDEQRKKVLEKSEIKFSEISEVDDSFWSVILNSSKMAATWINVYCVYQGNKGFNEPLISFLNMEVNFQALALQELDKTIIEDETELDKFGKSLMVHPAISLESLPKLLDGYGIYFEDADLKGIAKERVQIMLENDRFYFRSEMFAQLQSDFPGLQKLYVENNWEAFLKKIEEVPLAAFDYELLLGSGKLGKAAIGILTQRITSDLLLESKSLAQQFAKIIREQGLLAEVSYRIMDAVFKQIEDLGTKVSLLTSYFRQYTEGEIGNLLILMGGKWKEITNYKNPKFENKPANQALLNKLKTEKIFVTKADPKEGKILVYTKIKPK